MCSGADLPEEGHLEWVRTSTLPRRLQPMLATLTDGPFDDPGWVFEDKYDGFRMVAKIRMGRSPYTAATAKSSATATLKSRKRLKT